VSYLVTEPHYAQNVGYTGYCYDGVGYHPNLELHGYPKSLCYIDLEAYPVKNLGRKSGGPLPKNDDWRRLLATSFKTVKMASNHYPV
jgi:hypothetical protein